MKLIKPSYEILDHINRFQVLSKLELAGRTCYKSESKITEESASKFVEMICKRNHESVLEHFSFSVRFICDRGVSHELVRHRLASYSQESTRYCNYSKDKFGNELTFIRPLWFPYDEDSSNEAIEIWKVSLITSENAYFNLLKEGWTPQQARSVLPNSLKTEIITTANLREWKHILELRTSTAAHPQIRQIMIPLQNELRSIIPEIFK